ncbi:MmgE/PrpD family protein [Zwartia vadi]|uniref:MmgE/PrpD family protein n=1 Tax=Zwartia vadi TaxID=3058168 RepID=UPI0025B3C1ED|nr:MmgE/PrpD family protein [Zwartia vadi]MDN3987736.1 MmgE/PrpD family protein [Zwartia vadi]
MNTATTATAKQNTQTQLPNPAQSLAQFAHQAQYKSLPAEVIERARLHILDGVGLALASHTQDYAPVALAGIEALSGPGISTVIGTRKKYAARDAALANGLLVHGLDYDDTHPMSIVHPTVASLPAALAIGEQVNASWEEVLCAYVVGVESAIRLGAAVKGGFHHVGFHATGIVSHFSSSLVAAKLMGMDAQAMWSAQGITASTASGVQVFLEEGAWTKRFHPGWGAVAGITAAHLAGKGFVAPSRPYEGRFGLFDTHLHGAATDIELIGKNLGVDWQMLGTVIKPYPVCHFIHGSADAAIGIFEEVKDRIENIESIVVSLPEPTLHIVAEPIEEKQNATTDYEAKFSTPYVVAVCLLRGYFGLPELEAQTLSSKQVQQLAKKVVCVADPKSEFPRYFSGGVTVKFKDGSEVTRYVPVNKGAGSRALSREDISEKFMSNATMHLKKEQALAAQALILEGSSVKVSAVLQALQK